MRRQNNKALRRTALKNYLEILEHCEFAMKIDDKGDRQFDFCKECTVHFNVMMWAGKCLIRRKGLLKSKTEVGLSLSEPHEFSFIVVDPGVQPITCPPLVFPRNQYETILSLKD